MNKQALSFADVEALGAFELPSRELMGYLVRVTIGDVEIANGSFNDLVDARNFCVNAQVRLLQKAECEITKTH